MLQYGHTAQVTITDSTTGQVRNDFRFATSELEIGEGGSFTLVVPETAGTGSPAYISPTIVLAAGERVHYTIQATYGGDDDTYPKRELLITSDSIGDPFKVDGQFGGAFTSATLVSVARSATAEAPCTLQVFWVKLAN